MTLAEIIHRLDTIVTENDVSHASLRDAVSALREQLVRRAESSGTWPAEHAGRIFVDGALWWQFSKYGATAWSSERDEMIAEANRRYGPPEGQ